MRVTLPAFALCLRLFGQPDLPVRIGPVIAFTDPATDASGRTIAFGSTVSPAGAISATIDVYAVVNGGSAQNLSNLTQGLSISGASAAGISTDGSTAVFTDVVENGAEGVELVDLRTGSVRRLALDTNGCIRPLALCIACFYTCVTSPHISPDKSKVLYAVKRNQPFYTVNSDGSGLRQLAPTTGTLAPSPQRVISDTGQVVFTSTDVFLMNLDGSNIRNLTNFTESSFTNSANNATISADGNTIVLESRFANRVSFSSTQIWTVGADGSGLRQLTSGQDAATNPSLSADGSTVAFVQSGQIYTLHTGGASQRVAATGLKFSVAQSPAISDDGRRIAFLTGPLAGQLGAVYQVDADGSNLHPIYAPRAIAPGGVTSVASGGVAPSSGSLISIYGINLSIIDTLSNAEAFPLPKTLAGVSATANGSPLPLVTVSPWQINAQLPQSTPAVATSFQLAFTDGTKTPTAVATVARSGPAVFTYPVPEGYLQAAAFHAGTGIPADANHPTSSGETLETYGVGLGTTDPAVEGGVASPSNPVAEAVVKPQVFIGGQQATVVFAGLIPELAGVYQVNAIVPALKPGRYQVSWSMSLGGLIVVQ